MSKEERPVVVPIRSNHSGSAWVGSLLDQLHKAFADEAEKEQGLAVRAVELCIDGDGNVQISKDRAVVQVIKGNNNIQIAGFGDLQAETDEQQSCADNQCKNLHEGCHDSHP